MTLKMVLQKLMMNSYITWKNSDKFQFTKVIILYLETNC